MALSTCMQDEREGIAGRAVAVAAPGCRTQGEQASDSQFFFLTDILSGAYRSRLSQRLMRAELLKASARYGAG